jgi:hypothetical protein
VNVERGKHPEGNTESTEETQSFTEIVCVYYLNNPEKNQVFDIM